MLFTKKYRPTTLDDIYGQNKLITTIKKMISNKKIMSFIMFGPPATGKTSIGSAMANDANLPICFLNAVNLSKKDLERETKEATPDSPVIIYIDEIHRLDKPKQEYFLPLIESGEVILIGATTESPYHSLTKALRSRLAIFELKQVSTEDKKEILEKVIREENLDVTDEAKNFLINLEDIRVMLNSLDFAAASSDEINEDAVKALGKNHINGDKNGNHHYMMKAALQKSIRGSKVDAALYYLSRMLNAGDLEAVTRRLRIIAFEDIGLGDTNAIIFTEQAIQVAEKTGLPEARIPLALATAKLCLTRKDNSVYKAYSELAQLPDYDPPSNISSECPPDYIYPHDFENHVTRQQYMPDEIIDLKIFDKDNPLPGQWQEIYDKLQKITG